MSPLGKSRFDARTALTTSRMPSWRARKRFGSTITSISRCLPPATLALATPFSRSICGSITLYARS
jgi:hypothetical protein